MFGELVQNVASWHVLTDRQVRHFVLRQSVPCHETIQPLSWDNLNPEETFFCYFWCLSLVISKNMAVSRLQVNFGWRVHAFFLVVAVRSFLQPQEENKK